MGVFLHVEQALRRRVVLKLVWFTTQGFYFEVENLIFLRPFLLGISLKSALYWEIGMKSTALKRIKAFVSKMYFFFFWNYKGSRTRNYFRYIMLRSNPVILSQVQICYRSILSIHIFFPCVLEDSLKKRKPFTFN